MDLRYVQRHELSAVARQVAPREIVMPAIPLIDIAPHIVFLVAKQSIISCLELHSLE